MMGMEKQELFIDFAGTERRFVRGSDWLDEVSRMLERTEELRKQFYDDLSFTVAADAAQDVISSLKTLRYDLAETVQEQQEKLKTLSGELRDALCEAEKDDGQA